MRRFALPLLSQTFLATALIACSAPPGNSSGDGDGPSGDGDGDVSGDGDGVIIDGKDLPDGSSPDSALPARIRRLSNAEYDAAVADLFGTELTPGQDFPPDARQHGYTLNEAQRVDPVLARGLDAAATKIAGEVVARLDQFAPCSGGDDKACAEDFADEYGARAYRRPLTEEDKAGLLGLYEAGTSEGSHADGIALMIRGLLQSPGFLYVTELGQDSSDDVVRMTDYEIAASLSFLLTGGPPDSELTQAAAAGELTNQELRVAQALRLVSTETGKERAVRLIHEWLGLDRITSTAKDSTVYPEYERLKSAMADETRQFALTALESSGGSVEELLGATWDVANSDLADFYRNGEGDNTDVASRPGLLNRGAFLSIYAHAHETAPVLRGTAVMRRIGCVDIEIPTSLNVQIVPPVPDPELTTRERFSVHSADKACARCHQMIDPIGFSFEQFDGMGNSRTMENGKSIDSTANVTIQKDFDGSYADSTEFAAALATSPEVAECFARQMFRASAGESQGIENSEEAFLQSWGTLPPEEQHSLLAILVALAGSDIMIYRRPQ